MKISSCGLVNVGKEGSSPQWGGAQDIFVTPHFQHRTTLDFAHHFQFSRVTDLLYLRWTSDMDVLFGRLLSCGASTSEDNSIQTNLIFTNTCVSSSYTPALLLIFAATPYSCPPSAAGGQRALPVPPRPATGAALSQRLTASISFLKRLSCAGLSLCLGLCGMQHRGGQGRQS